MLQIEMMIWCKEVTYFCSLVYPCRLEKMTRKKNERYIKWKKRKQEVKQILRLKRASIKCKTQFFLSFDRLFRNLLNVTLRAKFSASTEVLLFAPLRLVVQIVNKYSYFYCTKGTLWSVQNPAPSLVRALVWVQMLK